MTRSATPTGSGEPASESENIGGGGGGGGGTVESGIAWLNSDVAKLVAVAVMTWLAPIVPESVAVKAAWPFASVVKVIDPR